MLKEYFKVFIFSLFISTFLLGCDGSPEKIADTTAPTLVLVGNSEITVAYGATYTDEGAISDDGTISVEGTVDTSTIDTYTLTYSAVDNAGNNAAPITRTVHVRDQKAPVISLLGEELVKTILEEDYSDDGARVDDDIDGVSALSTSDIVNTSKTGLYTLKYNSTDAAGNIATEVTRFVEVRPYDLYRFDYINSLYQGSLEIHSNDNTYQSRHILFSQSQFVVGEDTDFSDNQFYLNNGAWKLLDDSLSFTITPDGIAYYDDNFLNTLTNIEDLANQMIKPIEDSEVEILMPEGAKRLTFETPIIKDAYHVDERVRPNGVDIGRQYFQSLAEFIQFQCGVNTIESSDNSDSELTKLAFTCGQEGLASGSLVRKDSNGILIENVGTWEIKNLPNSTIQAIHLTLNDNPYPGFSPLFAMLNGEVWQGVHISKNTDLQSSFQLYNKIVFDTVEQKLIDIHN